MIQYNEVMSRTFFDPIDGDVLMDVLHQAQHGASLGDIARQTGLSLRTIHRIVHGHGVSGPRILPLRKCYNCSVDTRGHRKKSLCPACRKAHYRAQSSACLAVRKAIAIGMLRAPSKLRCLDCGAQAENYDHRDYSKPLDVVPVCRGCNIKRGPAM